MEEQRIVSTMNLYLHKAAELLAVWLGERLPDITEEWWTNCVVLKLSESQRQIVESKGSSKLGELDLSALLRVADKNWYEMSNREYLTSEERGCVKAMFGVRNSWAHIPASLPAADEIVEDIAVIAEFLDLMRVERDVARSLDEFADAIKRGYASTANNAAANPQKIRHVVTSETASNKQVSNGDTVYIVSNPELKGYVVSVSDVGGMPKYDVFVDGRMKSFYKGQIALDGSDAGKGLAGIVELRRKLTAFEIANPSSSSLYSLNSARIDFVPYQFRPVLKISKADEPRILIADSVGVGKTIEAGLIVKELEARADIDRIAIICPKPLVSERKWELEMKRFDEDFVPLTGKDIRRAISDCNRDGEWPVRFSKAIIPYSILDGKTYGGAGRGPGKGTGLADIDQPPHFDLVIVDEAHHIRNGSMEKERAFAYKCTKWFCDHADAVVMLTATPLQTSEGDLYTLLNILRPDVVINKETYELMAQPNEFVAQAGRAVRTAADGWQEDALMQLERIKQTRWGSMFTVKSPAFADAMCALKRPCLDRAARVKLISDIESLHSFDLMLNRTRRRDIQDFCVRRAESVIEPFTKEQKELHDKLLGFQAAALAQLHDARSVPFMMSTLRRQAASCIFGLAPLIRDITNRRLDALIDGPEGDEETYIPDEEAIEYMAGLADELVVLAESLPDDDPKAERVLGIIKEKQQADNNKIILFSTFKHTLRYLERKVASAGLRVARIDGAVKDNERLSLHNRFALPKDNPDALDVLMFTEVGSEGLDYQFCDTMINYDLPWNPMRIEQRIGRIDRRGQKSEAVNIYNVLTEGTVDADIYERCLSRIGVFERSVGDCEEILGRLGTDIERVANDGSLTDAERLAKFEQIADNEIRKARELENLEEQSKGLFGFDLAGCATADVLQSAESPWMSARSVRSLISSYIEERAGDGCLTSDGAIEKLRLTLEQKETLRIDLAVCGGPKNAARRSWESYLKRAGSVAKLVFEQEAADKHREATFVTVMHPLARQAARFFCQEEGEIAVSLQVRSDVVSPGRYPFALYSWKREGLTTRFDIVPVALSRTLQDELIDLLQMAKDCDEMDVDDSTWMKLEEQHARMWQTARDEHIAESGRLADYRFGSAKAAFESRRAVIEDRLSKTDDAGITRMLTSELGHAQGKLERLRARTDEAKRRADLHFEPLAKGIITIC